MRPLAVNRCCERQWKSLKATCPQWLMLGVICPALRCRGVAAQERGHRDFLRSAPRNPGGSRRRRVTGNRRQQPGNVDSSVTQEYDRLPPWIGNMHGRRWGLSARVRNTPHNRNLEASRLCVAVTVFSRQRALCPGFAPPVHTDNRTSPTSRTPRHHGDPRLNVLE